MFRAFGKFFHRTIVALLDFFYPPFRRFLPRQLYDYAACGALNTMQDWVLYFLLYNFVVRKQVVDLGFVAFTPHIASLLIVTPFTLCFGFLLSKYITFRGSEVRTHRQAMRYALIYVVNFLLTYCSLKLLVEVIGIYPTPSKMITTVLTTLVSFTMQKYYTFKKNTHGEPDSARNELD